MNQSRCLMVLHQLTKRGDDIPPTIEEMALFSKESKTAVRDALVRALENGLVTKAKKGHRAYRLTASGLRLAGG